MCGISQASAGDGSWKLISLTPEYLEQEHGCYVRAIDEALKDSKIRNIALSGNYGVGKSSILHEVTKRHQDRVVELSLSTLAPIEESSLNEAMPKQATTTTNRIQQEIVKQLIYREEPHKTPGSRFKRIERFNLRHELVVAFFIGLLFTVIFLLTGWTDQIATEFTPLINVGLWAHLIILVVAVSTAIAVRGLSHGRVHIRQLSAGAAAVILDEKSVSYFDQYLDEIVYSFEVSKRDIVIFEDIDRFNDSYIFETLRSLNALLNASPQTNKPIRFIYAVRDSIFGRDRLELEGRCFNQDHSEVEDPAQAEAVRANRTKFFDLVIPVVPFITHRSARNLAAQLLQDIEQEIDENLIDLASQYVPDMRLLKNVRNEFIVFRDRIFFGDGRHLNLCQSELFAMMLYKSTHMTDFEAIRNRDSNLDELYSVYRILVSENIKRIESEVRVIRQRLAHQEGASKQSAQLGDQLIALVELMKHAADFNIHQGSYSLNGVEKHEDEFRSTDFWIEFVREPGGSVLRWSNRYGQQLSFTYSDLVPVTGISLEPERWSKTDREELQADLAEHLKNLEFLRRADIGQLGERPEFQVDYGGLQSLDAITRQLLKEGLAYQLVRAGYINRNFTLYTSTFHGDRVSSAATNFIIHHVQPGVMDEYYELQGSDVEAVIRECGREALSEPALYNIAILDYLLHSDTDATEIMVRSLVRLGDDQRRFLQAYLSSASERTRFVERFAVIALRVLVYLVSEVELDEAVRLELVSIALANLDNDMEYRTDSAVAAYLKEYYDKLPVLALEPIGSSAAMRITRILLKAGILVPELRLLSETVQQVFIKNNLYEINRENLEVALGSDSSLALDAARGVDKGVYEYMMKNLSAYLSAIDGVSATVDSGFHFTAVIDDVLNVDSDQLGDVIAYASVSCVVPDLTDVSESAWSFLAEHNRFPATFSNISRYIGSIGMLDAELAKVLTSARVITEHEAAEEDDKQQLAKTILAAREHLPCALLRAELVVSLELDNYLDVEGVTPENGELFALLLKERIIEDDTDTYTHILGLDWSTRESFIVVSSRFIDYVAPDLVQGDLSALLSSKKIDSAIKTKIAEAASDYLEGSSKDDLVQLARFATQYNHQLTLDVVACLASMGVPARDVVVLLEPHLETIARGDFFDILQSLGGQYMQLTSVGYDEPKIPNTSASLVLLEALKQHGIVSMYKKEAELIRVYKKRK